MTPTRTKKGLTRRQALVAAGAAGAGVATTSALGLPGLAGDHAKGWGIPDFAEAATCVLTPSMTEGPYFVDELLDRADIRASKDGVKLTLTFNVFSADANCDPFTGATVDMWQCDAQGSYSDVAQNNTVGQKFLRGYQVTDGQGQATFTTIFPGWYQGRTIHIHLKFRVFDGNSTTYEYNTQLFFENSDTNAVLATSDYQRSGTRSVTNANDGIFDESMVVPLDGNVSNGYTGTVDIGLAGMPDEATATDPDGNKPDTTDTKVSSKVEKVKVTSKAGGKRTVVVTLANSEKVSADARLLRGGRLLSRKRTGTLARGSKVVRLPVTKSTRAGKAVLRVVLKDSSGNSKVVRRVVRIPSKKR